MNTKNKGSIFIENIVGLALLVSTLIGLSFLNFRIWAESFTNIESFYISRARLYGNTQDCRASTIVPQSFIKRKYLCI
jgi:hypothetical protein